LLALVSADPAVPVIDDPDEPTKVPKLPMLVRADPEVNVNDNSEIVTPDVVKYDPGIDPPDVVTEAKNVGDEDSAKTEFALLKLVRADPEEAAIKD